MVQDWQGPPEAELQAARADLASASAAATAACALESGAVLGAGVVAGVAGVALSVASFIPLEVVEGAVVTFRVGSVVAVVGIVAIIYVAVEAAIAVEPGTGADEGSAAEPVWTVIAVGRAVVGSVVVVAVGAARRRAEIYAHGDLGWAMAAPLRSAAEKIESESAFNTDI